jgi:hypothetical protein
MRNTLVGLSLATLLAEPCAAQSIARDSLYDHAETYWRARMIVVAPSGDSLAVTCGPISSGVSGAIVRFYATEPWSASAITTATQSFGSSLSSTGSESRMSVLWSNGKFDSWGISFLPASMGRGAGVPVVGARAGTLKDGDNFILSLAKFGRVGITYPVADWVRSFEMAFTEPQRASLKDMADRCRKKYEGTQKTT